jgi:hypothetical protein
MDITMNLDKDKLNVDLIQLQKMAFLFNALENGWSVRKENNYYVFKKNHEGKKEVYLDKYLQQFLSKNLDLENILK